MPWTTRPGANSVAWVMAERGSRFFGGAQPAMASPAPAYSTASNRIAPQGINSAARGRERVPPAPGFSLDLDDVHYGPRGAYDFCTTSTEGTDGGHAQRRQRGRKSLRDMDQPQAAHGRTA